MNDKCGLVSEEHFWYKLSDFVFICYKQYVRDFLLRKSTKEASRVQLLLMLEQLESFESHRTIVKVGKLPWKTESLYEWENENPITYYFSIVIKTAGDDWNHPLSIPWLK